MFKVPKKTSVWKINQDSPVGTMKFAPELVKFIKEKKKFRTYRFADEKYGAMKVGDVVTVKENFVEEPIGKARITAKQEVLFRDIPYKTENAHESCESKEHQRKVMSGYYACLGRPISDDDPFIILDFELL